MLSFTIQHTHGADLITLFRIKQKGPACQVASRKVVRRCMPARLRRMRACCMLGGHLTVGAFTGRWPPTLCSMASLAAAAAPAKEERLLGRAFWNIMYGVCPLDIAMLVR